MIYLWLLLGFFEVGAFSFGGAYAAIPFIREVVLSYGWLSDDMISYIIAVSESTPGPVMVNMATYVGSTQGGILGSVVSTFAVVLPAFVIILLITAVFRKLLKTAWFSALLLSLQACVIGIIAATGVFMIYKNVFTPPGKSVSFDVKTALLTFVLAILYFGIRKLTKKNISPIYLIVLSAVAGVFVYGV